MTEGKQSRGFAKMDAEKQREIASKGGKAVSQDRAHMSAIGRRGGESSRGTRQAHRLEAPVLTGSIESYASGLALP